VCEEIKARGFLDDEKDWHSFDCLLRALRLEGFHFGKKNNSSCMKHWQRSVHLQSGGGRQTV